MADYGFAKVCALSPRVTVASPFKNAETAIHAILNEKAEQSQIIVLPELYLSGSTCGDLFFQSRLIEETERALALVVEKTGSSKALVFIGVPLSSRGRLFNCAAAFQEGKLLGVIPKCLLSGSGFSEKRYFSSGSTRAANQIEICGEAVPFGKIIFDICKGLSVSAEIGEELNAPVSPGSIYALNGASVIANLSAENELVTKNDYRKALLLQQSAGNICACVFAGAGAGESSTDLVFSGSCAIAEGGRLLAESERFLQNGTDVSACIDVERLSAKRQRSSFYDNAETFFDSSIIHISAKRVIPDESHIVRYFNPHPFVPEKETEQIKRCEEILLMQGSALAKRLNHTGMKKVVLGLSGGLDSTLALLACKKAFDSLRLPAENILCCSMPGFGTGETTRTNAQSLAKSLGVSFKEIDIKPACIQHMRDIGHNMNVHDVTYENVQARERTQILMDIANSENALLIGTGDLSELALGWCTYNGDHMSMYSINCGIPKTLVRRIVAHAASCSDEETAAVLNAVLNTPISPELLPPEIGKDISQKTEDSIGPYDLHDFFIYNFIRFGFGKEKLLFMAARAFKNRYSANEISKWLNLFLKRFFSQQFKRSCAPDGPAIGSIGFSPRGGLQMPSDADAGVWLD